jgi:anti-sigma28 factor (negative regulator of flagellin synthesis)
VKIEQTQIQVPLSPATTKPPSARSDSKTSSPDSGRPSGDAVEVSEAARVIGQMEEQSNARIAELREQVRSGQYKVDSAAVGKRIVQAILDR